MPKKREKRKPLINLK